MFTRSKDGKTSAGMVSITPATAKIRSNLERIKLQVDKIRDIWNHYIYELKYFQKKIRFTPEVQTNYFGDVLNYFEDTFDALKKRKTNRYQNHIFNTIGLLQVIYIHQDLMDEILHIFRLPHSAATDKNPNRELRNELVGHPIRRKKEGNEMISSVFFSGTLSPDAIQYTLYSKQDNFKGSVRLYPVSEVIESHLTYLEKYFAIVIGRLDKLLIEYKKQLTTLEKMIDREIGFEKIVNFVDHSFEKITAHDYLFKKTNLLCCYNRRTEHSRYNLVVENYRTTLKVYIKETLQDIEDLLKCDCIPRRKKRINSLNIQIRFGEKETSALSEEHKERNYLTYEISKLFERKHPIFSINYFREKFKENQAVLIELNNMESNQDNQLEYYSSYHYLKFLLNVD